MATEERRFTPAEAEALLPEVTRALLAIREARQVVLAGGERLRRRAELNGGGAEQTRFGEALQVLRREVEGLTEIGIILRDPEKGLVDFPSLVDGVDAFLCWQLGEARVAFWHGPESGFAGRKALRA
ncbi:MAG: DUF2203 family protein [Actinobacteria bacterium]|nr:MAG: DUF2203 family protein [Actinomycetota bacterium]